MVNTSAKKGYKLKENVDVLKILAQPKWRKLHKPIINRASPDLLRCICNCAKNILNANIPLKLNEKTILEKKKKILRELADSSKSIKHRGHIIKNQKGGFFAALLAPLLGALIGPIVSSISNAVSNRHKRK